MRRAAILLMAGSSARMGFDKLFTPLAGICPAKRSLDALVTGGAETVLLVTSPQNRALAEALPCPVPIGVVTGGAARSDSVRAALRSDAFLWQADDLVLIHDAARCLTPPALIRACFDAALAYGSGVAALPLADTVLEDTPSGVIALPREQLLRTQTPQAFSYAKISAAYGKDASAATDDATLYAALYGAPHFVTGSEQARKLTTAEDWVWASASLAGESRRCGTGFDTHRLVEGRRLLLGGVEIPFEKGLLGHSDADVLLHALMDALLGACNLGDIGWQFPDSDPRYLDADSRELTKRCVCLAREAGFAPVYADATVLAERPRLAPYRDAIKRSIADALGLAPTAVSVKATTTEGMNDEGRGLCISAQAIVTVCRIAPQP